MDATLPGGMDFLRVHNEEDLRSLPEGVWGIKEPQFHYQDAPRTKGTWLTPAVPQPQNVAHSGGFPGVGLLYEVLLTPRRYPTATDEDSAPLDVILIPGAFGAAEASEYPHIP